MNYKLWVDDRRAPPDETWIWAKTNTEAIRVIDTNDICAFSEISLDHDICHEAVDCKIACGETFEATARFIARAQTESTCTFFVEKPELKVHIHTANPVGKELLVRILNNVPDLVLEL